MAYRRHTDEQAVLAACQHLPGAIAEHAVLVPLDGSAEAGRIVPVAHAFARYLRVPVQLVAVAEHAPAPEQPPGVIPFPSKLVAGLVRLPATLLPAETIVDEARRHKSRLIALSARSQGPGQDRVLGQVTLEVLRRAPCSVLVVRPELAATYTEEHPSLTRILLPLNGAPSTAAVLAREGMRGWLRALKTARKRSGANGGEGIGFEVLHVVELTPRVVSEPGTMVVPRYMDQPYHEWDFWARQFLERFCSDLGNQAVHLLVGVGDPGTEIVRTARERDSDLIMISWKGEIGDGRGAAVETLLREAPCPILFVRIRKARP
jgi:nucleotide-binding universal stress UspA family protein